MKRPSLYLFVLVIISILFGNNLFILLNEFNILNLVLTFCFGIGLILILLLGYRIYKANNKKYNNNNNNNNNNNIFILIIFSACFFSVFCFLKAIYINYNYSEYSSNYKIINTNINNNNTSILQGTVVDVGLTSSNNIKLLVNADNINTNTKFNQKVLVYINIGYLEQYAEKYFYEYLENNIIGYTPEYKNYYYLDENIELEIPNDLKNYIKNYIQEYAQGINTSIDVFSTENLENNLIFILENIRKYSLNYIKIGDYISLKGTFDFAGIQKNFNAYDEELIFKVNSIYCKMYASRFEILEANKFYNNLLSYISSIRLNIFDIYDQILPNEESSILKAMLVGDKQFLEEDTTSIYQDAGIYHILAISGLHIGCLAGILTSIFGKLHRVYGKLLVIFILIFYCIIAGSGVSTIRATLMYSIMILGNIFYKNDDFLSSICISGIILLAFNPFYLFDIGFLYSFSSVICIATIGSRIVNLYELNKFKSTLVVSFFICLSIKPITAYYFYNLQLYDFFLNIIILPFMSIVVFIGFIATILGSFNIYIAEFFIGTVYYILKLFTYLATLVTKIEFSNIIVGRPSFLFMFCFYLALFLIAFVLYDKYKIRKRLKFISIGLLIFIFNMFISLLPTNTLTLTVLDVGQGDSIVGSCPAGDFLIDGGGERYSNIGQYVVLPYLKSQGINKLEFVFISHEDTDHIKGILEIIGYIQIDSIFLPKTTPKEANFKELIELASLNNIDLYYLDKGDSISLGDDILIEVLYPYDKDEFYRVGANNNSLVFKLFYDDTSILFTGDIEETVEKFLVSSNSDLKADVLKIGHHGSKSSTTQEFLDAVDPQIALISCKLNNIYNHPSEEVIDRLNNNLTSIYRTDLQNAITLKIKNNNISVNPLN